MRFFPPPPPLLFLFPPRMEEEKGERRGGGGGDYVTRITRDVIYSFPTFHAWRRFAILSKITYLHIRVINWNWRGREGRKGDGGVPVDLSSGEEESILRISRVDSRLDSSSSFLSLRSIDRSIDR